jgi:hypothetical protein
MSLIQYVEGDLFGKVFDWPRTVILPHVVNSKGVWGAGFVVPLGRNIPVARDLYLEWAKGSPNIQRPFELGQAQIVKYARDGKPDIFVANMLAQTLGGVRPLSYTSLVACMEEVALFARERTDVREHPTDIVAPAFGSALAGGRWDFIQELIKDAWLSRGIAVTIYYLPGQDPRT